MKEEYLNVIMQKDSFINDSVNNSHNGFNIPKAAVVELSQSVQFCIGFKQLLDTLCPTTIHRNYEGVPISLEFADGSSVGILRIFTESGHFTESN